MSDQNMMMNERALFSDESGMFRCPEEPDAGDSLTIRFRTWKDDVDQVRLHIQKNVKIDTEKGDAAPEAFLESVIAMHKVCRKDDGVCEAAAEEKEEKSLEEGFPKDAVSEEELSEDAAAEEEVLVFDTGFDFFETEVPVGEKPFWYYFSIKKGKTIRYYNQLGVVEKPESKYSFVVRPGVHVPEWAKGAVIYQIFTDRFCNGDPSNDVLDREYLYVNSIPSAHVQDWSQDLMSLDVGRFYGGDLKGVLDKLDYIKKLGVDVIYFNPLFVSPSNHKYDIQDYDYIDPHYGVIIEDEGKLLPEGAKNNQKATRYINRVTSFKNLEASNELFAKLCEEAHKRGMRVILDGVFNHCGSFNKWMDRECIYKGRKGYEDGAFVSKKSPYHNFFHFSEDNWPYNQNYNGWWGNDTLPKLNYEESDELCDYVMGIGRKWVSPPYNVDGWRLDVAADLGNTPEFNHNFWKRFRENVKDSNPDALILAEHYGDAYPWLQGDEWDTIMNYDAFMDPVTWFLTGLEKHSDRYEADLHNNGRVFYDSMRYNMCRMHRGALLSAMNELSNHDHSRFMTRTNCKAGRISYMGSRAAEEGINKGIFREGIVIQMTWPGAPTIYYGDETGLCGWTDPDSRRPYPWDNQDLELIEFHKYMTGIHHRHKALRTGSLKFMGYGYGTLMYGRFLDENRVAVAINNQNHDTDMDIPVWEMGIENGTTMFRLMCTSQERYNVGKKPYIVENGMIHITVHAYGAVILSTEKR